MRKGSEDVAMRKSKQFISSFLICLAVTFSVTQAVMVNPDLESNLLRSNYSFELDADGKPDGWRSASPTVSFQYITAGTPGVHTHSGTHAISMSDPTGTNGRWYNDRDGNFQQGQQLLLSFWFKAENFDANTGMRPVIDWSEKGVAGRGTYWGKNVKANVGWTKYEVLLSPPASANSATLSVRLENSSGGAGTVYIDDIYFGPYLQGALSGVVRDENPHASALLPGAEVALFNPASYVFDNDNIKYSAVTDAQGGFSFANLPQGQYNLVVTKPGFRPYSQLIEVVESQNVNVALKSTGFRDNLLSNADFEQERSTSAPDFWRCASAQFVQYEYIIAGKAGENTYGGNHALAMRNPTGRDGRWFSDKINVESIVGKQIVLAFWLKTENLANGSRFYPVIEWKGASASFLPGSSANADWTYYVQELTVPSSATSATITLKFEDTNDGADGEGAVYLDDMYFGTVQTLAIKNVNVNADAISPQLDQKLYLDYEVNMSSIIAAKIFNSAGALITESELGPLIGASTIQWTGKDEVGANYPDGKYSLQLTATDGVQEDSYSTEFFLDSAGPENVEILEPASTDGSLLHNLDYIDLTAKTSEPKAAVKVFRGEAEVGSGEADLSGKITLRAAPLLEGENILRVVAYDRLGNPSSAEATITIDYDPDLALGIVKITNGSIFSPQSRGQKMLIEFFLKETAMLSFSVSAAGGAELYSYAAQIQAGSDVQLEWNGQDQSGNWLADGSYNYAVEVEFTTGQRGTRSGVVVVDNTQPDKPHLQYPALASTVTSITPHLKWEEAADAEYYLVMYSNDEQFSDSQVASATGNDYLLELGSQGTYYWKVKAVDLAGNESEWSQTWNFQLGELDRSTFQVANFSMQPNPFSPDQDGVFDELVIGFTLQQPGDVTLTIYNLAGQKVFKRELGELTWGDHQLAWNGKNQQNQRVKKGAYILHLTAKNPNYGAVASIIKHILVLY